MISYERSLDWQDLFDLALRIETPQEDIVDIGYRVSGMSPAFHSSATTETD